MMPTFHKLTPEEVARLTKGGDSERAQVAREYDDYLAQYDLGEWAKVDVNEDESKLTVKNRMKAAAKRRGIDLHFRRSPANQILAQLVASDGQATDEEQGDTTGNPEEEEQFEQQQQSEAPEPSPRRRRRAAA